MGWLNDYGKFITRKDILSSLDEDERNIYLLTTGEGDGHRYNYRETARILRKTEDQVVNIKKKALEKLSEQD
jgi:DNA-directed RNA polymerase sigma subunit (sigma70/sigma32)